MTTAYARFAATAFFCLFFLAVSNGARAVEGAPGSSPFARTGLLAHPGETAEEILLRAHEFDAGAMALAVAGYNKGLGGFPEFRAAATAWSVLASRAGLSRSAAFLFILRDDGSALKDDEAAEWLAACEYGKSSRLAPLLREAGIFDIERECLRLLSFKRNDAAWEEEYRVALAELHSEAEKIEVNRSRARRLTSGQLTEEDEAAFAEGDFGDLDVFFFYAATTHDPEKEAPDWRAERLLHFVRMRKKDKSEAARELERSATVTLMRRLGLDLFPALELICRTHAGDTGAARAMGMAYLNGCMNFPLSHSLANIWLRYGATAGDDRNMELRAVQLYAVGDGRHAWVWAKLASEFGDADMRKRVEAILQSVERDIPAEAIEARQKLLEEMRKDILDSKKMK